MLILIIALSLAWNQLGLNSRWVGRFGPCTDALPVLQVRACHPKSKHICAMYCEGIQSFIIASLTHTQDLKIAKYLNDEELAGRPTV